MKTLCIAFLLPLIAACTTVSQSPPVSCGDPKFSTDYFPEGVFFDPNFKDEKAGNERDLFDREWYSAQLRAMREPSLSCFSMASSESYRFLWLPTFDRPIAVRISRLGNRYTLDAVILDGAGGYDPGNIEKKLHRDLTQAEWEKAVNAIAGVNFKELPTVEKWFIEIDPETGDEIFWSTNDGTTVVIEGRDGAYHAVSRHENLAEIRDVSLTFLDLAGIKITDDERTSLDYFVMRGEAD